MVKNKTGNNTGSIGVSPEGSLDALSGAPSASPSSPLGPPPSPLPGPSPDAPQSPFQAATEPLLETLEARALPSSIAQSLDALCREYRRLGARISSLQKDQKEVKESIEELALDIPAKKITGAGWSTNRQCKTTREIDQQLLMLESASRNYDPIVVREIITASTVEKKGKEYVTVTGSGEEEGESKGDGRANGRGK